MGSPCNAICTLLLMLPSFLVAKGRSSITPKEGNQGSHIEEKSTLQRKETWTLLREVGVTVDTQLLRDAERKSNDAVFAHGKEFLEAISRGLIDFEVFENRTRTTDLINLNDYNVMSKIFLYDTHTSYSLRSNPSMYLNLDDPKHMASFGSIRELTNSHVIQCGHDKDVVGGTFLVGTSRGSWASESAVEYELARATAHLPPDHVREMKDRGLTMIRKVIRTVEYHAGSVNSESCSKLHTESVHPVELFSKMRVQTITESPFHHIYRQKQKTADDLISPQSQHLRKAMSTIVLSDVPVVACTGTTAGGGARNNFAYHRKSARGCVEYSDDVPGSFNFNYDPNQGTAITQTFKLVKGVTCEGCYAFLGAGLMIIIDYKHSESGFIFDFEAKAGGGVGSSTTVTVTDPSISGVNLITLMAPGEEMYTSLGFGLSMYFKFGGLTATLSGSGSATGPASYSNRKRT